jgi:hypothetical protein
MSEMTTGAVVKDSDGDATAQLDRYTFIDEALSMIASRILGE